ncbi:MAG: class I SAM-dependent methyltransferase family protein [Thermoplasmatales archaeon]|nr:class I SAM-dependent methyltransferase family protein [Thermoplasmatales archaeon]
MKSLCVKVERKQGEEVRKKLLEMGVLNKKLVIKRNDFIYIPLTRNVDLGFEIIEKDFDYKPKEETDYKKMVEIPDNLRKFLPTSFDIIGDIAIIKLEDELLPYKKLIGDALLMAQKHLRTVCVDRGVKNKCRIRDLEIVAGEKRTETTHTEYGIKLMVDVSKVYFSPRLASEHYRVAKQVLKNETVTDMFTGVGGFAVMIAKHRKQKKVFAIDINEIAVEYLKKNIKINKVKNVVPILGDAKKEMKKIEKVDRVIMNLPHKSYKFFESTLNSLKNRGTIHYYEIIEKDKIKNRISDLEKICEKNGCKMEVIYLKTVKTYSPTEVMMVVDVKVREKNERSK